MPVEGWFATPLYFNNVQEPVFSKIQQEFSKVVSDLKRKNGFEHNPDWEPNTHKLSDISFTKNLIEEYNLSEFENELEKHVRTYLEVIGCNLEKTKKYKILQCWMTNTYTNEYAHLHSHGEADISGCYYFKTNENDGNIYFNSPLRIINSSTYCFDHLPSQVEFGPQEGKILLFPGWIEHGVRTNITNEERISVSFNIYFERGHF